MKEKQPIDPRTTRRSVPIRDYERNSALFATYEVVGYEGDIANNNPSHVTLQRKPEFCVRQQPKES